MSASETKTPDEPMTSTSMGNEGASQPAQRFDLDFASKTVALAGTRCLLLSAIYDWGFIHALGLSFATIPTSLSDHLRGALNWLPVTLAYIGAAALLEVVNRRIEGGFTEHELIARSKRPSALRRFRDTPYKIISAIAVLAICLWVALGDPFLRGGLWLLVSLTWLNFSRWVISHPTIRARMPRNLLLCFAFIPAAVSSVYLLGDNAAHATLKSPDAPVVVLATEAMDTKRHLALMRVFERVAIVRDEDERVSVIRISDILRIEPPVRLPFRGLFCGLWPRACAFGGSNAKPRAPVPTSGASG
jgi:hypothetical protein